MAPGAPPFAGKIQPPDFRLVASCRYPRAGRTGGAGHRQRQQAAGERYQASPIYSLRKLLRRLDIDHADFSFIDIGSGKGRALLLAGELPFRRVTGVEFSPALHACALRNIAVYRRRQASAVTSVLADASDFVAPLDNLLLYFFNPFTDAVLVPVMQNLAASLRRYPRRLLVIYLYLPDAALLERWPELCLREQWHRYHVFEWIAPAP